MEDDTSATEGNPQKLLEIFQALQLAKNKKTQLQIAIEKEEISRSYNASKDLEAVSARIKELNKEILEEASVKNAIEMAVQRLQMSDVIYRLLADDSTLTDGDEVLFKSHKNCVEEMLKRQADLSSELLQKTQEMEELQQRVTKLRKDSLILTARRKRLLAKIEETKQGKHEEASPLNSDMQKIIQKIDDTEMTVKLITPILQSLIVGSGVNWAQDEYLKELMLSLGRPVDELLKNTPEDIVDDSRTAAK